VQLEAHLLIAVGEVHEAVVVVVVVWALGPVGGQQQVVGPQAVPLRVCVGKDPRLQQLVVRIADPCSIASTPSPSSFNPLLPPGTKADTALPKVILCNTPLTSRSTNLTAMEIKHE